MQRAAASVSDLMEELCARLPACLPALAVLSQGRSIAFFFTSLFTNERSDTASYFFLCTPIKIQKLELCSVLSLK